MRQKIYIVFMFFIIIFFNISLCGIVLVNSDLDSKAPSIFTSDEIVLINKINKDIQDVFIEVQQHQGGSNLCSGEKQRKDQEKFSSRKKRRQTGGKSLYQMRMEKNQDKKMNDNSCVKEISVMNKDFSDLAEDHFLKGHNDMSLGQRVIYYKQKYLNLAQKYLQEVMKNYRIKGSQQ
jgi:hypothetical protein